MALIIVHDLKGSKVLLNTDQLNIAIWKVPGEDSAMDEPYSKLFFRQRDMSMGAMGFPDTVKESPEEIVALSNAVK